MTPPSKHAPWSHGWYYPVLPDGDIKRPRLQVCTNRAIVGIILRYLMEMSRLENHDTSPSMLK